MKNSKPPLPEIYILGKDELPLSGKYYVVTGSGIYLHKENGVFEASVRVSGIGALPKFESKATLKIPKIPADLFASSLEFMRVIFRRDKTESTLLIFYDMEGGRFRFECPVQINDQVHSDSIGMRIPGFRLVGSIHSHPEFQAYHSGVDQDDEDFFDGIHLVVGNIMEKLFSMSAVLVVNGNRFKLSPEKRIDGLVKVDVVERVSTKPAPTVSGPTVNSASQDSQGPLGEFWRSQVDAVLTDYYSPALSIPTQNVRIVHKPSFRYRLTKNKKVSFPQEWLDQVQPPVLITEESLRRDFREEVDEVLYRAEGCNERGGTL